LEDLEWIKVPGGALEEYPAKNNEQSTSHLCIKSKYGYLCSDFSKPFIRTKFHDEYRSS
jgi:hypothetical protein